MVADKVLIVDDSEINRDILRMIFEEKYSILEAGDGETAISLVKQYSDEIAVVFLDQVMPKKCGLDVLKEMKEEGYMNTIPVIMITGETTLQEEEKAYEYGCSDVVYKPFSHRIVFQRAQNVIQLFQTKNHMEDLLEVRTRELVLSQERLRRSREQLRKSSDFLVNALGSVVEFRSLESSEHVKRVQNFTKIIMKKVLVFYPEYNLTEEDVTNIVNASALHDIGKVGIPDAILLKPGRLTDEEYAEMKRHTLYGCQILESFKQEHSAFYGYCYDIVRYHHERYDGRGYPDGLVGEACPIWAQAVAVADVFDALVSKRVYKDAYSVEEAINMIKNGECGVFSHKMLKCFEASVEDFQNAVEGEQS
ncbi:MAG: response regulator [Lachnospiraceae bacterium]|nr:response regulator [Lachnospiraceae bacterium]